MNPDSPHLAVSRVFDAPRALVFEAFTDPDQLATWWGPRGNTLVPGETVLDVRPGGFQRWTEVSVTDPDLRVDVYVDLTEVTDGALLEGVMRISGRLQEGLEPFATRFRIEFHDEPDNRTRLEVSQWLPAHLIGPSTEGWGEAFDKLDTTLHHRRVTVTGAEA